MSVCCPAVGRTLALTFLRLNKQCLQNSCKWETTKHNPRSGSFCCQDSLYPKGLKKPQTAPGLDTVHSSRSHNNFWPGLSGQCLSQVLTWKCQLLAETNKYIPFQGQMAFKGPCPPLSSHLSFSVLLQNPLTENKLYLIPTAVPRGSSILCFAHPSAFRVSTR